MADEEALGTWGAEHLAAHELDAVAADYVITESGGIPIPGGDGGIRLPVLVAREGLVLVHAAGLGHARATPRSPTPPTTRWSRRPRSCAASPPSAPETQIHDTWRAFLDGMGYPDEVVAPLLDPGPLRRRPRRAARSGMARQFHACTHTTIAPTVVHGGTKTNVIPDRVDLQLDIRTLPGQELPEVQALHRRGRWATSPTASS